MVDTVRAGCRNRKFRPESRRIETRQGWSLTPRQAMHPVGIPPEVTSRVEAQRGAGHVFSNLIPERTALVVVAMQNAFLKDEVAFVPIPVGREIVPNINRLADALRHAGGLVVWIQTPVDEETARGWSCFHEGRLTPARSDQRLASLRPGTEGHELWEGLDVRSQDAIVRKT